MCKSMPVNSCESASDANLSQSINVKIGAAIDWLRFASDALSQLLTGIDLHMAAPIFTFIDWLRFASDALSQLLTGIDLHLHALSQLLTDSDLLLMHM